MSPLTTRRRDRGVDEVTDEKPRKKRRTIGSGVGTVNVAGEIVPVDLNGAYPLAGWEIEGALHDSVVILSGASPLPTHPGAYVYNTRLPSETSPAKPGHWVAVYIPPTSMTR